MKAVALVVEIWEGGMATRSSGQNARRCAIELGRHAVGQEGTTISSRAFLDSALVLLLHLMFSVARRHNHTLQRSPRERFASSDVGVYIALHDVFLRRR